MWWWLEVNLSPVGGRIVVGDWSCFREVAPTFGPASGGLGDYYQRCGRGIVRRDHVALGRAAAYSSATSLVGARSGVSSRVLFGQKSSERPKPREYPIIVVVLGSQRRDQPVVGP